MGFWIFDSIAVCFVGLDEAVSSFREGGLSYGLCDAREHLAQTHRQTNIRNVQDELDGSRCHCFTSKRLADDQLPGVPEAELARTRHHILVVGSVLVVNCETVVFWLTNCGAEKELLLSISIV